MFEGGIQYSIGPVGRYSLETIILQYMVKITKKVRNRNRMVTIRLHNRSYERAEKFYKNRQFFAGKT
jgi:hypothetical protein